MARRVPPNGTPESTSASRPLDRDLMSFAADPQPPILSAADAAPEPREFALLPGRTPMGTPLMVGLLAGFLALRLLSITGLPEPMRMLGGLLVALGVGTLASTLARRQIPDRLRLTGETVELARGTHPVRRVELARLSEVNELPTMHAGKVLFLADHRQSIVLAAGQLVQPHRYEQITQSIIEALQRLDPTGLVGPAAVRAGRVRDEVARQPVRAAPIFAAIVAGSSLMGYAVRGELATRPFPDELLGALSGPLVFAGETWRLLSYPFLHASGGGGAHLVLTAAGLLWLGAYLERIVGWERLLLGIVAGVVGGAAAHVAVAGPLPALGASPAVFGLLGVTAALAIVGRKRLPRAMLPRAGFWGLVVLLALLLPGTAIDARLVPLISFEAHAGALLAGLVVGLATLAGRPLPVEPDARAEMRAFAWVAIAALGIGFIGGVIHPRRGHVADDEIVARAILDLPPHALAASYQNNLAYTMVSQRSVPADTLDIGARLASAAVDATGRQQPHVLDTLAVARYKQGQVDEARELIVEALMIVEEQLKGPPAMAQQAQQMRVLLHQRLEDFDRGGELSPDPTP